MKASNTIIGILAHVDAGKTTLSESILYETGAIRARGRVDHGDAFLDTNQLEKKRGITIFSKLARFTLGERPMTLLDTPGHVDFSPEMERTLRVLDLAILVISGPDQVTPQVRLLWKLLEHYHTPTLLFVNKMDQLQNGNREHDADQRQLLVSNIRQELSPAVVPFGKTQLSEANEESVAVCDDALMEGLLDGRHVTEEDVCRLVAARKLFPLYDGSALQGTGVPALLEGIRRYAAVKEMPEEFGALVYKVTRDPEKSDARLVWMKLTGGRIAVRDTILQPAHTGASDAVAEADSAAGNAAGERNSGREETPADQSGEEPSVSEKISGIRRYSGGRYELVTSAAAGEIVAVTGLAEVRAGEGLGFETERSEELLSPIMTCRVIAEDGTDSFVLLRALRGMEEEEPMLHVAVQEETGDITIQIMGQVQLQVLQDLIRERYGLSVTFGPASIVYKETIREPVEGVGHFEPLRHYAEVHVLLTPTEPGTGLTFENACPPNTLDRNWQRLIMTHLQEKTHKGVLTGSDLTDLRITLIGGKASRKHTVGGDFRQATYRAVRQGLMMAQNVLLEPVLSFRMEVPSANLGRALNDIALMHGHATPGTVEQGMAVLEGTVPAESLGDYAQTLAGYTGGQGRLSVSLKGYEPCHIPEEVIDRIGYDPEEDLRNPSSSVFCSHGAATIVPWQEVRSYMQLDTGWSADRGAADGGQTFDPALPGTAAGRTGKGRQEPEDFAARQRRLEAGEKELRAIFEATYGPIRRQLRHPENEKYYAAAEDSAESGAGKAAVSGQAGSAAGTGAEAETGRDAKGTAGKHGRIVEPVQEYLLVDGYNIIFAWTQLRDLAGTDIKAARDRLMDILQNYAGYARETVIVVFDAYRVPGGTGEVYHLPSLDVVYTKEAETADLYIEKTAHQLSRHHRVTVATSDAVEQVIIYGSGALRLSARGLLERIMAVEEEIRGKLQVPQRTRHVGEVSK